MQVPAELTGSIHEQAFRCWLCFRQPRSDNHLKHDSLESPHDFEVRQMFDLSVGKPSRQAW